MKKFILYLTSMLLFLSLTSLAGPMLKVYTAPKNNQANKTNTETLYTKHMYAKALTKINERNEGQFQFLINGSPRIQHTNIKVHENPYTPGDWYFFHKGHWGDEQIECSNGKRHNITVIFHTLPRSTCLHGVECYTIGGNSGHIITAAQLIDAQYNKADMEETCSEAIRLYCRDHANNE